MNDLTIYILLASVIVAHVNCILITLRSWRQSNRIDDLQQQIIEQKKYINQLLNRTAGMIDGDIPITRMAEISHWDSMGGNNER